MTIDFSVLSLAFMFTSMIQLKLIFVYDVRY